MARRPRMFMPEEPDSQAAHNANPAQGPASTTQEKETCDFRELMANECQRLHPEDWPKAPDESLDETVEISQPGPADEPWVNFTRYDHLGLALSGGGIRSATFNLGLLQGLDYYDVLKEVDISQPCQAGAM